MTNMKRVRILFLILVIIPLLCVGCFSSPSIGGNWYTSIPYSEDGLDLVMDITLSIEIDSETEGELTGDVQLSGQGETDQSEIEFVANVDIYGEWRLDEDFLYITMKRYNVNVDPDNVSFSPNFKTEDGLINALSSRFLKSILTGISGFLLPIDSLDDVGKQYVIQQIKSEINSELKEFKNEEYLLGTIILERKTLTIQTNNDIEEFLPVDNGEMVFYKF